MLGLSVSYLKNILHFQVWLLKSLRLSPWRNTLIHVGKCESKTKSSVNPKNEKDVLICRQNVIVNFFDVVVFLLSSLHNDPSHVSIITGSGIKIIFIYKGFYQDSGNWKDLCLNFAQCSGTLASWWYQMNNY